MAQSYLIFDFGANEEAAQQARHKLDTWKQAFRLGKKLELKFERGDDTATEEKESKKAAKKDAAGIRVLVRLDFSDHEKLSLQRWLDRIPAEEPFKSAELDVIRAGDATHAATTDHFDSLD